ncbi:ead/Ea22-like family protein [Pseudomonas citronellolis]|uniref:ead/Ea22-like family protein n=1 Tax=Pseudomonas citronellolis TaxID=53408 RepID=UPI0021C05886|nr:ead/Ea22-like family protein [Pseudomonas citronellolis]UXJ54845.1 ead/Ea22-like family protein [Pseudomonas citronellolis]
MTDHAELRRLAVAATPGARYQGTDERVIVAGNGTIICTVSGAISGPSVMADAEFLCATDPKTVLALLDEIDGLLAQHGRDSAELRALCQARDDARKERDRLKAENDALRGALQAVEAEVDGNIRPLTRDLVNMVSGLKNGSHPNDIYEHCDEIERIIGAALEGDKP